ncbi:MAG: translocation/assembly module TamB domain-containing protein, partial [Saprospiraceae bacterium]
LDLKLDNRHNSIDIASDWLQGQIKGYFVLADLSETISNVFAQYFVVDRTAYVPPVSTDSLSVQLHLLRTETFTTGLVPGLTRLDPISIDGALIGQRNYFNLEIHAPRIVYQGWDVDSLNVRSYAGDSAAMFVLTTPLVKRYDEDFIHRAVLNGRFLANMADVSFKASNTEGKDRFLIAAQAALNGANKTTLVHFNERQLIDYKDWQVNPENKISITPAGVEIRKFALTGNGQSIKVDGTTKNLAGNKTGLDIAVDIDRLNYNNFDIFVAGILNDLGGWAEAQLKINGTTDALKVRGKMQLHETFFTPTLTNVRYELSETPLEFTESGINLNGLSLRDPYGKTLEINGNMATTDWKEIRHNLTLHADRWQVMNSTKQQNPVYYGEVYVSLDGSVRGSMSQPDIQLVIKTAKESNFTYVYDAATQALQHEGIVVFVAPERQYVRPPIYDAPVTTQPFTLSASIEIDSNLTVSSVIDPVTGDDFRGKAQGKLQLDILSNGNMTLAGRVELVSGVYNYSYQSVVKRSFEVTNGSTITWTGDVTKPELDLRARYEFKASPYPLVVNQLASASTEQVATYRKTQVFFLQTSINGSVSSPEISFRFISSGSENQGLNSSFSSQQNSLVESALS